VDFVIFHVRFISQKNTHLLLRHHRAFQHPLLETQEIIQGLPDTELFAFAKRPVKPALY
jgi:hypothetical protein